jgi:hypothetical protein
MDTSPWFQTEKYQAEPPESLADQLIILSFLDTSLEPGPTKANGKNSQDHHLAQPLTLSRWERVASHLSQLYRQHLAIYVGAVGIEIPDVYTLQISTGEREGLQDHRVLRQSQKQYQVSHAFSCG